MTQQECIKLVSKLLNIQLDETTLKDMIEETNMILDYAAFARFCKQRFNYQKFQYLGGYPKFIALVTTFKEEAGNLTTQQKLSVNRYSNKLWVKLCDFCDDLKWDMDEHGKSINDVKNFYQIFDDKEKLVLDSIGNQEHVYMLSIAHKENLKSLIEKKVYNLSFEKNKMNLIASTDKYHDAVKKLIDG